MPPLSLSAFQKEVGIEGEVGALLLDIMTFKRDHVLPKNWELSYRRIPWRTSFWDAVIEAQARDKPILLWAMNGHPLCNT